MLSKLGWLSRRLCQGVRGRRTRDRFSFDEAVEGSVAILSVLSLSPTLPHVVFLVGLCGYYPTYLAATFAYSADCSSIAHRAREFGFLTAAVYLGDFIGPYLGGFLYDHVSIFMPFLVCASGFCMFNSLLLLVCWI